MVCPCNTPCPLGGPCLWRFVFRRKQNCRTWWWNNPFVETLVLTSYLTSNVLSFPGRSFSWTRTERTYETLRLLSCCYVVGLAPSCGVGPLDRIRVGGLSKNYSGLRGRCRHVLYLGYPFVVWCCSLVIVLLVLGLTSSCYSE